MNKAKIKICGVTTLKDSQLAVDLGADLLGLNFYPPSPRCIEPEAAAEIIAKLSRPVVTVAVTVNLSIDELKHLLDRCPLDVIQLHGGDYSDGEDHLVLEQGVVETLQELQGEGKVRFLAFTTEGSTGGAERLVDSGAFDVVQLPYNLMNVGISDFEKGHGLVRRAHAVGMGITVMRPLTGGVLMRLMERTFPDIDLNALGELLLNYVLSDPYISSALVGTRSQARLERNAALSDDTASRLDLEDLFQYFLARRKPGSPESG